MPRPKPGSRRPHPRDKPCRRCLAPLVNVDDRFCPTCGLSVWFSLNPNDSLDTANPAWTRWIVAGTRVMAGSLLLSWIGVVLGILAPGAAILSDLAESEEAPLPTVATSSLAGMGSDAAHGAGLLMAGMALWLLSVPERRVPDRDEGIRIAMRIIACFAVADGAARLILPLIWLMNNELLGDVSDILGVLAALPAKIMFIAVTIVTWVWIRRLARRARKAPIARISGWFILLPLVPFLKFMPIIGVAIAAAAWSAIDLIELLYDPAAAVLLLWAGVVFARARRDARHTWDAETKPPLPST